MSIRLMLAFDGFLGEGRLSTGAGKTSAPCHDAVAAQQAAHGNHYEEEDRRPTESLIARDTRGFAHRAVCLRLRPGRGYGERFYVAFIVAVRTTAAAIATVVPAHGSRHAVGGAGLRRARG